MQRPCVRLQKRTWARCQGKRLSHRFWLVVHRTQKASPTTSVLSPGGLQVLHPAPSAWSVPTALPRRREGSLAATPTSGKPRCPLLCTVYMNEKGWCSRTRKRGRRYSWEQKVEQLHEATRPRLYLQEKRPPGGLFEHARPGPPLGSPRDCNPAGAPEPGAGSSSQAVNELRVCEVKDEHLKSGSARFSNVPARRLHSCRDWPYAPSCKQLAVKTLQKCVLESRGWRMTIPGPACIFPLPQGVFTKKKQKKTPTPCLCQLGKDA